MTELYFTGSSLKCSGSYTALREHQHTVCTGLFHLLMVQHHHSSLPDFVHLHLNLSCSHQLLSLCWALFHTQTCQHRLQTPQIGCRGLTFGLLRHRTSHFVFLGDRTSTFIKLRCFLMLVSKPHRLVCFWPSLDYKTSI